MFAHGNITLHCYTSFTYCINKIKNNSVNNKIMGVSSLFSVHKTLFMTEHLTMHDERKISKGESMLS